MKASARRRLDVSAIEALLFGRPGIDPHATIGRLASFLYIASGLVVLATLGLVPPSRLDRGMATALAAAALVLGAVCAVMPWHRWSRRAFVVPVVAAFILLGVGNLAAVGAQTPYNAMYVIVFLFIGLALPPGSSLVLLPIALASYLLPELGSSLRPSALDAALAAPVWVLVAEVVAWTTSRFERAEQGAEGLLKAITALGEAESVEEAAYVTADLPVRLVGADSVLVFAPDDNDPSRFVNLGQHNAEIRLREMRIDRRLKRWGGLEGTESDGSGIRFLTHSDVPSELRDSMKAESVLIIPLTGESSLVGAIVAGWETSVDDLGHFEHHAVEILSREAARALERHLMARRLLHAAQTDALSGLANRRRFERSLDAIRPRDAVVVIDLDYFKEVNDGHGHAAGDELLRTLASCLHEIARRSDTVARYGGDEFALVLPDAGEEGARATLQRIRTVWASARRLTTFSAGIAVALPEEDPRTTFARADAALYSAKTKGRGRTELAQQPSAVAAETTP